MSVFMQPIYTQTVGAGGAGTITFNNIPQGFTDLKIVVSARSGFATGDAMWLQLGTNNTLDSNEVYSNTRNYGTNTGAGVFSDRWYPATYTLYFASLPGSSTTANTFINGEIYIANYTNGNFKQIIYDGVFSSNSASNWQQDFYSALFRNKASITNLSLGTFNGGGFVQNTTVTIYGISNTYDTKLPTAPTIETVIDQSGFASVAFTPASNDQADSYMVTSTPSSSTIYGDTSPIVIPATLGTSYTYKVAANNALGSSISSDSSALTSMNSYSSISTVSLTSGTASSVVFSNIPQNYSHLQIRGISRNTGGGVEATVLMQFNSDTGSNYTTHYMGGNGSATLTGPGAGFQTYIYAQSSPSSGSTANVFGAGITDILDYTTTKAKSTRSQSGYDANGSGLSLPLSGAWVSTAPITNITLSPSTAFAQYSHFALYGIA